MDEPHATVLVEIDEGVAVVTLNRPEKKNAINFQMDAELHDALWRLDRDESVRAIVITGAGDAFCAGFDMSAGAATFGAETHAAHDETLGVDSDSVAERAAFWRMVTPTIAAINGAAMGVGITLPLLFDVRLAAEDAKIGFVFTRRGIIPEANSNWILPRLIGVSRALELLMSGRTISGTEAAAYGIVSRALPRDELMPAALEFARDMAANTAPGSVAIVKHLVYRGLEETDRLAAMQRETKLTWFAGEQPDAIEGVMAFIERRPPAWKGSKHVELPDV
jgi:enoyl-CoA hydratase/carnithine racemase